MKRAIAGLMALTVIAAPALAVKDTAGTTALVAAPVALKSDMAYLLLRTSTAKSGMMSIRHVLLRIPSAQEIEDYKQGRKVASNSFVVDQDKFLEDGTMRTLLIEVPPGEYLFYGITIGGGGLVTCNCLGTVKFAARAGVITDLGSAYADKVHKPSPIPHLEDNLGPQMFQYGLILGEAVVPADAATPVPAALKSLPVERAAYRAVGQFTGGSSVNRLPPIPGVLAYVRGKPVDPTTGKLPD
ncbi:MAG: hypothetical protein E7773_13270 [Sphingomonas sp.]|uniref:hypothetical protein n=1 Tax=Sphingomonas sp. TaxID=28214 RepID=UPI0011FD1C8C|nr:hypothetical protein [Sphingomonas sp.]THD35402.1 MAG: hypothetical protein E7773_13270 [Sphingomonas sp.]